MTVNYHLRAGIFRPGRPNQAGLYAAGNLFDHSLTPAEVSINPAILNQTEADLALAEVREDALVLTADAFGQTPVFYAATSDGWAWGFDLKSLLAVLPQKPSADEAVFFDYLATHYRHVFRDPRRTFYAGVYKVPAGTQAVLNTGPPQIKTWLDLGFDGKTAELSPSDATECFMDILRNSVARRIEVLGPRAGFTVSSGLDSSTVAALGAAHLGGDIQAFSVGYQGEGIAGTEYDETSGLAPLVNCFNWRWHHLRLGQPDLIADLTALMEKSGSPVITVTWLAHYLMAKEAKRCGVDYLFSGIGGDENLAGEYEHFFYFLADLKRRGDEERLTTETQRWARLHDHPVHRKNETVLKNFWAKNIDLNAGLIRPDMERYRGNFRFFNDDWLKAAEEKAPPVPMPCPYPHLLSSRIFQELKYETTPPTLWGEHHSSLAAGLKGAFPFLSPRLFKLTLSLPSPMKYDNGLTKALLRRGLGGVLPQEVRFNHVKTGFNAPLDLWLRNPATAEKVFGHLSDGPLPKTGWLAKDGLEKIFKEHKSGAANHMMLIWCLLNTSIFLDGASRGIGAR